MPGRAGGAEPAAGRDRRAGGRGRAAAGARARRRPAGDGARRAPSGAVPPRPDPRGGPARAGPAAAARPAAGDGAAAGRGAGALRGRGGAVPAGASTPSTTRRSAAGSVGLLRRAADQATLIGDHALVNALLTAALRLVDPADAAALRRACTPAATPRCSAWAASTRPTRTTAAIEELCPTALDRGGRDGRAGAQPHPPRPRFAEAIELGLESLRELRHRRAGRRRALSGLDRQVRRPLPVAGRAPAPPTIWPARSSPIPALLAASRLIDALLPAAYFVADRAHDRLAGPGGAADLDRARPEPTLIGPVGHAAYHAGPQRGDYAAGVPGAAARSSRSARPADTSPARRRRDTCPPLSTGWFEPIENGVQRRSPGPRWADRGRRPGLRRLHLPARPCRTRWTARRRWTSFLAEVDDGLAFLRRTGNEQTGRWLDSYAVAGRRAARRTRRRGRARRSRSSRYADDPTALFYAHLCRAIAAAIFGDPAGLAAAQRRGDARCCAVVHGLLRRWPRSACCAAWPWPRQARATDGDARAELLAELDELTRLAGRTGRRTRRTTSCTCCGWSRPSGPGRPATSAPPCSPSTPHGARCAGRQRPWHRALIAERAARFFLAHGVEHAGYDLLAEARDDYLAWGATAKVAQLDWAHPPLRRRRRDRGPATPRRSRPHARPSRPGRSTSSASWPRRRRSARRPASSGCTRAWPRCSAR